MSMICYCGSMQFVGVSLLTAAFDPFQALLMSVMVNARHAFLRPFHAGKVPGHRPGSPCFDLYPDGRDLFSGIHTGAAGGRSPEGLLLLDLTAGLPLLAGWLHAGERCGRAAYLEHHRLGFTLTALFIVLLLEQVKKKENRAAGIIGMVCTAASLAVFGPDNFLIPAMILLLAVLLGGRKKLCK